MPKLDFFSGQPEDEAMASKEASGASGSGENWDDAFAGMQKLDLFEDDAPSVSVAEPSAPGVTQAFPPPEISAEIQQVSVPEAVDQKETVGKSVFESLFADDDFEEEDPVKPAKGGLFGARGKAKKAAEEAPMFASLFDDDPEEPAVPMPAEPDLSPVMLAVEPPMPQEEPHAHKPEADPEFTSIEVTPPAPAAEQAPPAVAVPVFADEKAPESDPAPSRNAAARAKPIDWHADMLSQIQPRQVIAPSEAGGALPQRSVGPLEEPAWKPILESAMMERAEEPADYTADEAATRTFVPGVVPAEEPAPVPVQPEPIAVAPVHVVEQPAARAPLFEEEEQPQHSARDIASNIAASFDSNDEDLFAGFDDFGAASARPAPFAPQPQEATSDDIFGGLYDADPEDGNLDDNDDVPPPPPRPRARRVQDYPSGGGGSKKIGIFVAIAVVILALLVAVYFLFFNKKDQKDPTPAVSTPSVSVSTPASVPSASVSVPEEPVLESIPRNEWYLKLVNRSTPLDDSYSPELGSVGGQQLDTRVVDPMTQMIEAAKNDGITLKLMAGYRTYARQKASYEKGTTDCPPGASEHNLGLSADVMSTEDTSYNTASFEKTKAFAWLQEHAVEYGFILRYPSDKKDVTGFDYEPWHYRYVGSEQALKIKASGLTLEEYLAQPNPTA